ncbi:MAG: HAD family hydrolase [Dehalococcoidia bacterium]|nr:HAD family hydrolase [Dehalococcoidia bacterium]
MTLPKAILIDLDDTIVDDGGSVDACWREVCAEAEARIAGLDAGALRAAIERARDWFWSDPERHRSGRQNLRDATRQNVERALGALGYDRPDVAAEIANRYRDLREERVGLFPGAIETLERLRSRGIRLGMVTNGAGPAQRAKVRRFGLEPHFDHILIEGEYGIGKPQLEVYEAVLRELGAEPARAWSVGDNLEWDVGAPQRLGVYGVWVDGAGAGLPDGSPVKPDRIIRALPGLLDITD